MFQQIGIGDVSGVVLCLMWAPLVLLLHLVWQRYLASTPEEACL